MNRRMTLTLGVSAGAVLVAALMPTAVAFADEYYLVPDPSSMVATSITGDPPYSPLVVTGTEDWGVVDVASPSVGVDFGLLKGVDTSTTFESPFSDDAYFVNDAFSFTPSASDAGLSGSVDFYNYGNMLINEWVDIPTGFNGDGFPQYAIADFLITSSGVYQIFGDSSVEGLLAALS
jgi:hypothetical protein